MEVRVETSAGSSLEHTQSIVDEVHEKLEKYEKDIETNYVNVGSGGMATMGSSGNTASFMMQLVPSAEREKNNN